MSRRWLIPASVAMAAIASLTVFWHSPSRHPAMPGLPTPAGVPAIPTQPSVQSGNRLPDPDDSLVPQGRYVFERNCAVCHGRWGDGRGEMAVGMFPKPRKLTSGIFKFRSTPSGFLPTDADLDRTIRQGIANSSMPTFAHLPARDVEAVIAYLKTLSSRWRNLAHRAEALSFPSEPDWLFDPAQAEPHAVRGRALYNQNCQPCHGVGGEGKGPAAAALEDQWGEPCPPADLRQPHLKSGAELRDVFRVLTTGLDGTPMPSFAEAMSAEDRWDLIAFIGRLRAAVASP